MYQKTALLLFAVVLGFVVVAIFADVAYAHHEFYYLRETDTFYPCTPHCYKWDLLCHIADRIVGCKSVFSAIGSS